MRTAFAAAALAATALSALPASATDVRFMMDWAWQGPQSFALMARDSGCFAEGGVNITLDRGFGSGRIPVELAAGNYDMGIGDINSTIRFRAENPDSDVIAVAIIYNGSPLVAIVRADGPIQTPADLNGRTMAAPELDAGRQLFPIFAGLTGIDTASVNWISVDPVLREPMLVRGEADGITGFITSAVPSLAAIGLPRDQLRIFRYVDFGAELYSNAIQVTRRFAEANPEAVATVVGCMIRGVQLAVANPEAAIDALAAHEPLTDREVELGRLQMGIEVLFKTEDTIANGIGGADMAFLQRSIISVENAYGLPNTLLAEDFFDARFLPPQDQRMFLPN